jgi:hypothetical protein
LLRRLLHRAEPTEADPTEAEAIAAFWAWWADRRDELAARIDGRGIGPGQIADVAKTVRGIHPRLSWELAPGRSARYALIVSPEGDAEVRPTALRWLAAAPRADETWEYFAARQPGARGRLIVDGHGIDLDAIVTVAAWDADRDCFDVRLWQPAFPELPVPTRRKAALLFLDSVFGEDDVERWIGSIEIAETDPGDAAVGRDALAAAVDEQRAMVDR